MLSYTFVNLLLKRMKSDCISFSIFWLKKENMHLHTEANVVFLNIHTSTIVLRPLKKLFLFHRSLQLTIVVSLIATESDKITHEVLL